VSLDYAHERAAGANDGRVVVGIDEVGRGPLAGPVVAAAVILRPQAMPRGLHERLADSKTLRPDIRAEIAAALHETCTVALGEASVAEIDTWNILNASHLAMARAVEELEIAADFALVDGNRLPALPCAGDCVVGGDGKVLSIAAASIVAKVARDRMMCALAESHPGYGWERNMGYGTAEHRAALARLGATDHHRRSFRPVREALAS
jgi:ribonuclease HII